MASDPVFLAKELVPNRFVLSVVAFERAKQLIKGARPRTEVKCNSNVTTALQEIAEQRITQSAEDDPTRWQLAEPS